MMRFLAAVTAAMLFAGPAASQDQPQPFTDLSEIPAPIIRDAFMLKVWECHLPNIPEYRRPIPTATETTGAFFMPGRKAPFLELDFDALRRVGVEGDYYTRHLDRGATVDEILEIMTIGNLGVVFPGQPCPKRVSGSRGLSP